jgi:hypothetical protein
MSVTETLRFYVFNLETTKIELHFDKAEYNSFSDEQKKRLQGAFLFSGKNKCWVSRAKEPNLYRAREVAKSFGFSEEKREGERISFAEQLERKADRAEERAERYEVYADNAEVRAQGLQKPINDMHGDIAFFTQPLIAGHSGSQAFARRREKMFEQYRKGFEEYRKSEYFKSRANTARDTASIDKLKDKGYLDRRIKECQKEIRQREKNLVTYENTLYKIENDECPTKRDGKAYTIEEVTNWLNRELELIEVAQDKEGFYYNCMDDLGGVRFSQSNIEVGFLVVLNRWGIVEVIGKGAKNITYKILTGGAAGLGGKAAYAEITEIKRAEATKTEKHPFCVGDTFTAVKYEFPDPNSFKSVKKDVVYEIIKASDTSIQLKEQGADSKPITRKPRKSHNENWAFSIDERYGNTFYKSVQKQ